MALSDHMAQPRVGDKDVTTFIGRRVSNSFFIIPSIMILTVESVDNFPFLENIYSGYHSQCM